MAFGDRNDPESNVSQTLAGPRAYRVLDELNTKSSVVYLKKVETEA